MIINVATNLLLIVAQQLTNERNFEGSNEILDGVRLCRANYNQVCWLRSVNYFTTNDRDKTLHWLELGDASFTERPDRYKAVSAQMKASLDTWTAGLDNAARLMGRSSDRLKNIKPDRVTMDIQEEIVARLNREIDELEKPQQKIDKNSSGSKQIPFPLPETIAPQIVDGNGKIDEKQLEAARQQWGKLPEKERAKVMVGLIKELPAKYKIIIEEWDRALAKHKE